MDAMQNVLKETVDNFIHRQSRYDEYDEKLKAFLLESGLDEYDQRDPNCYVYYKITNIKKWVFSKLKNSL